MNWTAGLLIGAILISGASAWAQDMTPRGGTPEGARMKNPVTATPQSVAEGQTVFQDKCAPCHGPKADGAGATLPVLDIKPADLTTTHVYGNADGDLFNNIKNGIQPSYAMPAWEGQLGDMQIWNVVNYLKTLRRK